MVQGKADRNRFREMDVIFSIDGGHYIPERRAIKCGSGILAWKTLQDPQYITGTGVKAAR